MITNEQIYAFALEVNPHTAKKYYSADIFVRDNTYPAMLIRHALKKIAHLEARCSQFNAERQEQ